METKCDINDKGEVGVVCGARWCEDNEFKYDSVLVLLLEERYNRYRTAQSHDGEVDISDLEIKLVERVRALGVMNEDWWEKANKHARINMDHAVARLEKEAKYMGLKEGVSEEKKNALFTNYLYRRLFSRVSADRVPRGKVYFFDITDDEETRATLQENEIVHTYHTAPLE
jgi:hypothetical protein